MTDETIFAAVLAVTVLSGLGAMLLAFQAGPSGTGARAAVARRLVDVTIIGAAALAALVGRA